MECKTKIDEYKRALDETEGRIERVKRERNREENMIKGCRDEEKKETLILEDRLFRLECDLESQVKSRDQLLSKIELQEKMLKSYDSDKEHLERLVQSTSSEVQSLKQELLNYERTKSQDKITIEEKEREYFKLTSRMDMIMNEKSNLVTDKDKFYTEFHELESKIRREAENTTKVQKELMDKSRECEKAVDDFRRCSSEKNHYQELTERLRNEMKDLIETKESGGVRHDRLERM